MEHRGEHLKRQAERLERQAEAELDPVKRQQLKQLARELRDKKREWERPR